MKADQPSWLAWRFAVERVVQQGGLMYRALGVEIESGILWFWIGTHADYDALLKTRPLK